MSSFVSGSVSCNEILSVHILGNTGWCSVCLLPEMLPQVWKPNQQTPTVFCILFWDLHSRVLHSCTIRTTDVSKAQNPCWPLCVSMLFLIWVANIMVMPTDYLYSSLNFVSVLAVALMWHSGICLSLLRALRSHQRFPGSLKTIITTQEFFLNGFCANKWLLCFWLKFLVCQR